MAGSRDVRSRRRSGAFRSALPRAVARPRPQLARPSSRHRHASTDFPSCSPGLMGAFGVAILVSRLNPTVRPGPRKALLPQRGKLNERVVDDRVAVGECVEAIFACVWLAHGAALSCPAITPFSKTRSILNFLA